MKNVFAGVDLGGTRIKAVLGEADGRVLRAASVPTLSHLGPGGVCGRIAKVVGDLAAKARRRPAALGVGVPGLVDLRTGTTKFLPNLPTQWRDVNVRAILSPRVGCPVYLLNDVRAATLGELLYGGGAAAGTMVFFALGTGVGGGVAVDGKLRLGPIGAAGELGHLVIVPDGPRCGCGGRGCLETLASAPAIAAEGVRLMLGGQAPVLRRLVRGDAGAVTTETMARAAARGDAKVAEAIARAGEWLGIGIANVVATIHPDRVVVGGGAAGIGAPLFDAVRRSVRERTRMFPPGSVRVERSRLGERAGVLGALALAASGGAVLTRRARGTM